MQEKMLLIFPTLKGKGWVSETGQPVEGPTAKPADLDLIPRSHMIEGKN